MDLTKVIDYIDLIHRAGDYVVPHKHEHYELIYYDRGSGATYINDDEVFYTSDTIQIIGKDVIHFERTTNETHVHCIIFDSAIELPNSNRTIIKNKRNEKYFNLILMQMLEIRSGFGYWKESDDVDINECLWQLLLSLVALNDLENRGNDALSDNVIKVVQDYIKANIQKKINFNYLAERVGYSYDWLRHLYKQKMGITLKQYQQNVRMAKAIRLLSESKCKVQDVSRKCGFSNVVIFVNWFKKVHSITPKQYSKMVSKTNILFFNVENASDL